MEWPFMAMQQNSPPIHLASLTLCLLPYFTNAHSSQEPQAKVGFTNANLAQIRWSKLYANSTLPCSEVNQVCTLNGKIVYTDAKAGKVKQYNPDDNSVKVLVGSGHNSSSDGTQDSCSFKQIKGICSVDKTLFVTGVSAGKVKIVTRLGETISFLEILGSL